MRRRPILPSIIVLALFVILFLIGCTGRDRAITLPETPVLSGQDRYVLAIDQYVRVYGAPESTAAIVTHLRQGDVLAVESRTPDEEWIEVKQLSMQGWIERHRVRLFSSREQALNARRLLDS